MWKPTAGWLFGMSVTILFLALWGRAVVVDTDTLAESVAPIAESSQVVDLLADWAAEEFVEAGSDPVLVEPTIDYVLESTAVGGSLERFITEVVDAAASSHPGGSSVDMQGLLMPVVPEIVAGLGQAGYSVSVDEVTEVVSNLDPLVIREPGVSAFVGPSSPTASRLGTASLLAGLAIVVFGYSLVVVSEDRVKALRELLTKVALSGLSFALFLRVGSWVLDPSGGRAPLPETLSQIAESKWLVPLEVAAVAGAFALSLYVVRRWLKRGEVSPGPSEPPRPQEEQPLSLSGLR